MMYSKSVKLSESNNDRDSQLAHGREPLPIALREKIIGISETLDSLLDDETILVRDGNHIVIKLSDGRFAKIPQNEKMVFELEIENQALNQIGRENILWDGKVLIMPSIGEPINNYTGEIFITFVKNILKWHEVSKNFQNVSSNFLKQTHEDNREHESKSENSEKVERLFQVCDGSVPHLWSAGVNQYLHKMEEKWKMRHESDPKIFATLMSCLPTTIPASFSDDRHWVHVHTDPHIGNWVEQVDSNNVKSYVLIDWESSACLPIESTLAGICHSAMTSGFPEKVPQIFEMLKTDEEGERLKWLLHVKCLTGFSWMLWKLDTPEHLSERLQIIKPHIGETNFNNFSQTLLKLRKF